MFGGMPVSNRGVDQGENKEKGTEYGGHKSGAITTDPAMSMKTADKNGQCE